MATFNAGAIEATLDLDVDPFQRGIEKARGEGRKFAKEKFTAKLDVDTGAARGDLATLRRELERVAKEYHADLEVRGIAGATAEVAALEAQLAALGRTEVDVDTDAAVAGIGRMRGGLRAMIPVLAMVATGLIPLSAAAVPALGLASNLSLAAAAGGTAILAFQGVGEALKTANKAGLEPTAENLAAANAAMAKLTPAAREFVGILRDMGDEAKVLKDAAANGLFPGLNRGLETVELERYTGLVYELSDALGDNLASAMGALDNPRWRDFFGFVKAEARPGIDALSTSVGNLAGFFASLWQAFDPLNDDFSDWLVRSTGDLRGWADALPDDPKFAEFVAYVREQGPEAADALAAVAGALVDIVVAAAPLGGVVLDVLTAVGDAVSFIAGQPFGPTLITGAAALFTFNKALAITEGLMRRMGMQTAASGGAGILGGISGKAGELRKSIPTVGQFGTALFRMGQDAEHATKKTLAAREAVRGFAKQTAGGVAAAAGVAAIGTGLADSLGATNSIMLATTGAMVGGVPGAIAGGLVGAFLDVRAAGASAKDSVAAFNAAVGNDIVNMSQYSTAVKQLGADMADYQSKTGQKGGELQGVGGWLKASYTPAGLSQSIDATFGGYASSAGGKQEAKYAAAKIDADNLRQSLEQLSLAQGGTARTTADLDAAIQMASPAMTALGVTTQDLIAASADGTILELVGRLREWQVQADSTAGRTAALGTATAGLGNEMLPVAERAKAMQAALEALLSPALNAEQATDAWHKSLQTLQKTLKDDAGFKGFSEAAMANRQVTRDYVTTSMERLTALAGVSTTTERDMAEAVNKTREEFIQSGIAAGFSEKEITKRANALGLTPKMVRTVFEAAGIDAAELRARELRKAYRDLPKKVQTELKAEGIPKTVADVDRLVEKYHLTEKQRRALITVKDLATKDVNGILAKLGLVDRTTASPAVVLAGASAVTGALSNIASWMNNLDGRVARTTVITDRLENKVPGNAARRAAGGPIWGPGTGTSDEVPIWASNGEHMWTAREVANAGGHAAVEALRAQFRFAGGGGIDVKAPPRGVGARTAAAFVRPPAGVSSSSADIDRLIAAIERNRGVSVAVSSREDLEAAMRALEAELRRVS